MDKKQSRLRRSLQTRHKIAELRVDRLTVFRSNLHIYANIVAAGEGTSQPAVASPLISTSRRCL